MAKDEEEKAEAAEVEKEGGSDGQGRFRLVFFLALRLGVSPLKTQIIII